MFRFLSGLGALILAGSAIDTWDAKRDAQWTASVKAAANPDHASAALAEAEAKVRAIEGDQAAVARGVGMAALAFVLTFAALVVVALMLG